MSELIIDKTSVEIIDELILRAITTTHGLITNWAKPYGISFQELILIGDRMKYGDEFVRKREFERERERIKEILSEREF